MSVPPDFLISGEDIEDMKKRIRKFKLSQLKDLARTMLLRIAGKKADLIERIEEHIENGVRYDDKIKLLVIGVIIKKILLHESIPSYTSLYNAIRFGGPNANLLAQLQQDTRNISARPDSESLSNMAPVPQMPRTKSSEVSIACIDNAIYFKPSPFYTLKQLILGSPQRVFPSQGRMVCRLNFVLSDDDNRIFRSKPGKMQVFLLCGAFKLDDPITHSADVEWPIPQEIYVNGAQLRENVKGIKGKPGTARPANITKFISRTPALNKIEMVYAGTKQYYLLYCFIAETRSSQEVADEIFRGQHIHLLSTIDKIKEEYTHGDDDLEVATSSLSLKCPLTYSRMKFPAKSIYCQHIQCFDCLSFLQLQEQIPTWTCPICSRRVELEELAISDYYLEILLKVNDEVESVTLNPDGSWLANVESSMDDESSSPSPKPKSATEEVIEIVSIDSESDDETPQPPPRPLVETIDIPLPELDSATVSHPQTRDQFTAEWNRSTTLLTPGAMALNPSTDEGQVQVDSSREAAQNNVQLQNDGASEPLDIQRENRDPSRNQNSVQNQTPSLQSQNSFLQSHDLFRNQSSSQDTQLLTQNAQPTQLETSQGHPQNTQRQQSTQLQNQSTQVQTQGPQLQNQTVQVQNQNSQLPVLNPQVQTQSPQLSAQNARLQTQSPQLQIQNTQVRNQSPQLPIQNQRVQNHNATQVLGQNHQLQNQIIHLQTLSPQIQNQDAIQLQKQNAVPVQDRNDAQAQTQSPQLQSHNTPFQTQNSQLQGQNVTQNRSATQITQNTAQVQQIAPRLPSLSVQIQNTSHLQTNVPHSPSQNTHLQTQNSSQLQKNLTQSHNQAPPLQTPASHLQNLDIARLQSSLSLQNGERTSTTVPVQEPLPAINTFPLPYGNQQNASSTQQTSRPMPELLPKLNGQTTQQQDPSISKVPLPPLRTSSALGSLPGLSSFSFEPSTPHTQEHLDVRTLEQNLTSMFRIKRAMNTRQEQVLNRKDLQERHEQLRANFQNNLRQNIETNGNSRPTGTSDSVPETPEYQRPGLTYSRSAFDLLAASRDDSRPLPKKTKTINGQSPVGTNLSPLNGQIEDFTLQTPQLNQPPVERTWNKRLHSEERSPSPTK